MLLKPDFEEYLLIISAEFITENTVATFDVKDLKNIYQ